MEFYISYKGKPYGSPMSKEEAEMKLMVLSKSFDGLEIMSAEQWAAATGINVASGQSQPGVKERRPRLKKYNEH